VHVVHHPAESSRAGVVPSVHRLPNATIYVYASDHAPPHFHVVGPNSNAQIRMDDLGSFAAGSPGPTTQTRWPGLRCLPMRPCSGVDGMN
jgi:hypothetical protein